MSAERKARIENSPNYRDGKFHNLSPTPVLVNQENKSKIKGFIDFAFRDKSNLKPKGEVPTVKSDLHGLDKKDNLLVWFGHSSLMMQQDGVRVLVDPVLYSAAPFSFLNKPFKGTNIYTAEDIPQIDYLILTHEHWDHLDYKAIKKLKDKVSKVICPLGIGEYFEYWGYKPENITELDWWEMAEFDDVKFHCLPARHYNRRFLKEDQALWASFMVQTPGRTIYLSGDTGYDNHFKEIAAQYPEIDLAILENGQYNEMWSHIHLLPDDLLAAAQDLNATKTMTMHHSKYALALHEYQSPHDNNARLKAEGIDLIDPLIGEVVYW